MNIKKTEKGENGRSELRDINVHEVSIVKKTANGKGFLIIKAMDDGGVIVENLQKAIDGDEEATNYFLKSFVEKATNEQMLELGYVKKEATTEVEETGKVEKSEEDKTETTKVEKSEDSEIPSVDTKGIDELTEVVKDLNARLQDAEGLITKMKNTTKGITDGDPMDNQPEPKKVEKSEYISDEITMGN